MNITIIRLLHKPEYTNNLDMRINISHIITDTKNLPLVLAERIKDPETFRHELDQKVFLKNLKMNTACL